MKRTRSLLASALVVVAALPMASCVQSDQKTTVAKDGSGTLSWSFTADTPKVKELVETFRAAGMLPPAKPAPAPAGDAAMGDEKKVGDEKKKEIDPFSKLYEKEEVEKALKSTEGNELKEYTHETKDGKDVVRMLVAFKSFENLCKSGVLLNMAVKLVKNEDGSYSLSLDAKAGMGEGGGGGEMDLLAAMLPQFESTLGGINLKTELAMPGSIVETNGTKSEDGTKATWVVDWKAVSGADATKKDATSMKVSFKGEGIELKPFSYKPDIYGLAAKLGIPLK